VTCDVVAVDDWTGVSSGGGQGREERWKFFTPAIAAMRTPLPITSLPMTAVCQGLARVPYPREEQGRRHVLDELLAGGIAALIAGRGRSPRSTVGRRRRARSPGRPGKERGPAEMST
jgi:hypothetical protein